MSLATLVDAILGDDDDELYDLSVPRDSLIDLTGGAFTWLPFRTRALAAERRALRTPWWKRGVLLKIGGRR